jgi:hypothetical protein
MCMHDDGTNFFRCEALDYVLFEIDIVLSFIAILWRLRSHSVPRSLCAEREIENKPRQSGHAAINYAN